MTSETFSKVVEPQVTQALANDPHAPAWVAGWLEQRRLENPTQRNIANGIKAYREHFHS
jgi:hypothetical protein